MNERRTTQPDTVDPAVMMLTEAAEFPPGARVLVYGGVLAAQLAQRATAGMLRVADTSSRALGTARRAYSAHSHTVEIATQVALPSTQYGTFDVALVAAPQSRSLARRWLIEARAGLSTGGVLYLSGANDMGIRSLIDDAAAVFGGAHTLQTKRHSRVARSVAVAGQPLPAWADEPGIALDSWYIFEATLAGGPRLIHSLPGVFSYDRLDAGTRLLLEYFTVPPGARVLDLGCGYGVLGLVAAERGAAQVDLLDENMYAVAAARRTLADHGVAPARVELADVRAGAFRGPYDLVVTNPPFHQGKAVDYGASRGFVAYARELLAPGGRFVLVANSFLRYDTLLRQHFAEVELLAQTPGFQVWQAWI